MRVSLPELLEALEFVSLDSILGEHRAILRKPTGKIFSHAEFADERMRS
jgi:hypothetical protein